MIRIAIGCLLCYSVTAAQEKPAKLLFPFLGHPVAEFADSLLCKDALKLDKPYSPSLQCMSFLVTPSTAVYRYGTIEFPVVFIFPDSTDVIRSFSHYRSYLKDSVVSNPKEDISALRDHFNRVFKSEGVRTKKKNEYEDSQTTTWKKEGIKLTLAWNKIPKRKNRRLESILELYIEEDKK